MRIAIIPAIFNHSLSYNENICANAFHELGHEVRVYAPRTKGVRKEVESAEDEKSIFVIRRVENVIHVGNTTWPCGSLFADELLEWAPQIALILAPLHGFGYRMMHVLPTSCKILVGFSDIPLHRSKLFNVWFIKRHWMDYVFSKANLIFAATAQTQKLLQLWSKGRYDEKILFNGLAVKMEAGSGNFEPLPSLTQFLNENANIACLITRITSEKNTEALLPSIDKFLMEHSGYGFVIAGLSDNAASNLVRNKCSELSSSSRILLLPSIDAPTVRFLFTRSRFSLWNTVSIGLYQSISMGCPCLLWAKRGSAEHLVTDGVNGFWYDDYDDVYHVMFKAISTKWDIERMKLTIQPYEAHQYCKNLILASENVQIV